MFRPLSWAAFDRFKKNKDHGCGRYDVPFENRGRAGQESPRLFQRRVPTDEGKAVRQKKSRCFAKKPPRNPKNSPTFAKKWGSFCCHLCGGSEAMWSKPKKEGTGESTGAAIDVMFVRRQIFAILFVVHLASSHRAEVIGGQLAVDNAVALDCHALSEGDECHF